MACGWHVAEFNSAMTNRKAMARLWPAFITALMKCAVA
jgi:hypothetical protein